ncbi:zinc-dependent peptidase [uncultured Pontibacter sp.]|uniref:zinc-dependent peptidase n=1 Tax=uncultured Pontibacter sp. TaxID=453356 RepID=UPI00260CFCF2|nr:zinc-dependent peptidase [uncultured Pontibacter sp.]
MLPPLCIRYAGKSMALAEVTPLQALLLVAVVYACIELAQYGIKQMRLRPFILELRRQQLPYYATLSLVQQKQFEKRVANFILQKSFVARGSGFTVTTPMKVRIAASAVQLTFGLRPVYFSHFKTLLVYPDRYYSTIFKRYHCGEVNMRGYIVLSWADFENGYSNATDGFNLGLHEMAHALHLENVIRNNEYDFLDREHLQVWNNLSKSEMQQQRYTQSGFIRQQACHDEHEFFAVCVESFFERSHEFRLSNPLLYDAMSQLLQQDPARRVYQL